MCCRAELLAPVVVGVAGLPVLALLPVRVLGILLARPSCTCVKDYFDWGRVFFSVIGMIFFKGL